MVTETVLAASTARNLWEEVSVALGELEERSQFEGKPCSGPLNNDCLPSTASPGGWQQSGLRTVRALLGPLRAGNEEGR